MTEERPLYHRLGGYDAIAGVVDDLFPRLLADPQLGGYWKGTSNDSLKRARQLVVDFLCAATGGPVIYTGRDMKTSHDGLGITESDWNVFVSHVVATLESHQTPSREREEFLAAAASLKSDIVGAPRGVVAGV